MAHRRMVLAFVFALSFLFMAIPNYSQADEEEGCCQFFSGGDAMGCQSYETVESCNEDSTKPGKKFFPGSECDIDTGFCEGYKPQDNRKTASGCCQMFFGEDPGCMYPSSPSSCTGENRTFVDTNECGEDGYCKGYKKE